MKEIKVLLTDEVLDNIDQASLPALTNSISALYLAGLIEVNDNDEIIADEAFVARLLTGSSNINEAALKYGVDSENNIVFPFND